MRVHPINKSSLKLAAELEKYRPRTAVQLTRGIRAFFPFRSRPHAIWNSLDGKKILATEKWPSPIDFDHPIFYRTRETVAGEITRLFRGNVVINFRYK